ncbi:MAG: MauE/DoxX family redox-associated membrane protein [Streptosporangiaceae bacterium]
MAFVIAAAASLVAETLLLSALYKVIRPRDYLKAVRSYRLVRHLDKPVQSLLAWAAPLAEIAGAALIFVPATRVAGLALAIAVLTVFYLVVGGDDRPVIANCGCWGRSEFGVSHRVLLARNAGLLIISAATLAGAAAVTPPGHASLPQILAAAGLALPFSLLALELPELIMLASLRPAPRS